MIKNKSMRVSRSFRYLTATRRDETRKTSLLMTFLSPSLGRTTNRNKNTRHVRSLIVSHRVYLEMGIIPPEAEGHADKSFEQSFSTEEQESRSKYLFLFAMAYRFTFSLRLLLSFTSSRYPLLFLLFPPSEPPRMWRNGSSTLVSPKDSLRPNVRWRRSVEAVFPSLADQLMWWRDTWWVHLYLYLLILFYQWEICMFL